MTKKVKRMAFGGALGKLAGTASNIVKSVAPAVAPKPQPGMSINPPSNRVSMNVPKSPQDQAAYTEDVQKRLAELKAPSSNANKGQEAAQREAAKREAVMKANTGPAPATGGIRASNDPSNPEIAQKLAEAKTYMQSVGKADTGYEPTNSAYSSLAGASKPTATTLLKGPGGLQPDVGYGNSPYKNSLSGPLGASGSMSAQPAPPGGGLNMDALNASKAQNPGDTFKKGGRVKAKAKAKSSYSSGGKVSSASKRGDGIAQRGKTKGRMV